MVRESRAPGGAVRRARCARRGRALVAHDLSKVTSRPRRALRASRCAAAPHVCAHTAPARGHTCLWVTTRGAFGAHSACVREGRGKAGAGAPAPLAPRPRRAEKRACASGSCERKGFVQWPEACHTVVATEERLCLILALVVWTGALGAQAASWLHAGASSGGDGAPRAHRHSALTVLNFGGVLRRRRWGALCGGGRRRRADGVRGH